MKSVRNLVLIIIFIVIVLFILGVLIFNNINKNENDRNQHNFIETNEIIEPDESQYEELVNDIPTPRE